MLADPPGLVARQLDEWVVRHREPGDPVAGEHAVSDALERMNPLRELLHLDGVRRQLWASYEGAPPLALLAPLAEREAELEEALAASAARARRGSTPRRRRRPAPTPRSCAARPPPIRTTAATVATPLAELRPPCRLRRPAGWRTSSDRGSERPDPGGSGYRRPAIDHHGVEVGMAGKFEVYQDRAGKYRFRLKASNGQVVATGEAYETKAAARNGCESVQRAAEGAPIEETAS
ncbi:YegP family protein [Pseudonocardia sp.]|uniref:YegP family protein n=1 Tax=Pseudonocardia sp. TaxID=60912 RepID=UPI002634A3BA|nr:YegP family protein [Pseudonocardia sp.]